MTKMYSLTVLRGHGSQNGSVDRAISTLKLQGEDLFLPFQALISILRASDKESHSQCSSSHPYKGIGKWILSMSCNSYREMCHLDLKQSFYFPISRNSKISWWNRLVSSFSPAYCPNPGGRKCLLSRQFPNSGPGNSWDPWRGESPLSTSHCISCCSPLFCWKRLLSSFSAYRMNRRTT